MPSVPGNDESFITPANHRLRKKIGYHTSLKSIFTPEKIRDGQRMIDDALEKFVREMEVQISRLGDSNMEAVQSPERAQENLQIMLDLTLAIKRRMEMMNYTFGYQVAQSLHSYLESTSEFNNDVLIAVCKYVAVLNKIMREKITGDGGKIGQEMLAGLRALNKKLHK